MKAQFIVYALAAMLTISACTQTKTPSFNEAMGWNLYLIDEGPYAEITVIPGGYAETRGFNDKDMIFLGDYAPAIRSEDGIEQPIEPRDYLKSFTIQVCTEKDSMDFEILREGESVQINNVQIPEMDCA